MIFDLRLPISDLKRSYVLVS